MLFLPEFRLQKYCIELLNYIINNYNNSVENGKETSSHLYLLFAKEIESSATEVHPYYKQAIELLNRDNNDQRKLVVRSIFDRTRAGLPTIHIVNAGDSNGINQLGDFHGSVYSNGEQKLENFFQSRINVICTSDNIMEVDILSYMFRALFIASVAGISALGFNNPRFTIQSLQFEQEVMPPNVYAKSVTIDSQYSDIVPPISIEDINNVLRAVYFIPGIKI